MLGSIVLVASGLLSTVDIGAYNELRLRVAPSLSPTGVQGAPFAAVDFLTMPYARFETKSRHTDFKVSYAAEITEPDLEVLFTAPQVPQLFQMADMSFWYTTRHWVIGASQGGAFGTMNFSFLTPYAAAPGQPLSGPPPVQLIPCVDLTHCANETVTYGASSTALTARYVHRNTTYSISPTYGVSGGLDAASRALVPLVSVPRVDFAFEQRVSRRDSLLTQGDITAAESTQRPCDPKTGGPALDLTTPFPPLCAPSEQWAGVREVWRHAITRRVSSELIGGATVARATINDTNDFDNGHNNPAQPYRIVPYPVFGAVLTYLLQHPDPDRPLLHPTLTDPPRPAAYVYTRVGPVVDTHYGIVDPRLEIGAAALKPINETYTLMGRLAFVRSLWGSSLDATYFAASGQVLRKLDKYRFEMGLGARGAWQHDPFTGEFWAANVFVSFVWHEPKFVL